MPYATAIIKLQLYFVIFTCELVTPEKNKYLGLSEVHGFFCRRRGVVALTGATCVNLGAYVSRSERHTNNVQLVIYDAELDRLIINLPNENKVTDMLMFKLNVKISR